MKQTFLIAFTLFAITTKSQTSSNGLSLAKGMTIEMELIGYKTPAADDPTKWLKMKPEKKRILVDEHNANVETGKAAQTSKSSSFTNINEVSEANGIVLYTGIDGLRKYKLTLKCIGDTVEYTLNDGTTFPIIEKNNDTIGVWYYGTRKFPKTIEVGSILPGHLASEMNLFPYDFKMSRRRFFQVSDGSYGYYGFATVRSTTIMRVNSISLNTPFYVDSKEEIEISGKKYIAYKLKNQSWFKMNNNSIVKEDPTLYFNSEYMTKMIKESFKNYSSETLEKLNKKLAALMGQNEEGYYVSNQENWYVPELGMFVKSRTYDFNGALSMESKVTSIK